MKTLRFLLLGWLAATALGRAQITEPGWHNATGDRQIVAAQVGTGKTGQTFQTFSLLSSPASPVIAEEITPEIQALANGLQSDWQRIFNYVHDNIRHVLYFGSKKGAQLTLLEKSGNDFDQCALLVALLRAAGYTNVQYQFGWMGIPYENASHRDLRHWLQLSLTNTNWTATLNYLNKLFCNARGYPTYTQLGDSNTFIFQRTWVKLTIGANTYYLDPAFKVYEPITGIVLTNAMGLSSNALISAAGGTDAGNYVTNVNEANLRGTLTAYTTNFLNHLQSNQPNASVEEILSGQRLVPFFTNQLQFTMYPVVNNGYVVNTVTWDNIPTNLMSSLSIRFAGTNCSGWIPQLQGQRLSLTFATNGVAQLWQDDTLLASNSTSGSASTTNVAVVINHPIGIWDFTNNTIIRVPLVAENNVTNIYQRTNATYALMYAFEPDWGWLRARQHQLDIYRQQGLTNTSREVVSETLNVMGLNWLLQTEYAARILAVQAGVLHQYHHRFGRMAQEAGKGYYVDAYIQLSGDVSVGGADAANLDLQNRYFALDSYFGSALEHGVIEQMQATNLVAASTVKMLQLANTNGQAVYLASSTNWSTIAGSLIHYDTNSLFNNFINRGYYLLLPKDGSSFVAGAGTWAGYGLVARLQNSTNQAMSMLISGGYNGGYVSDPNATVNPLFIGGLSISQPLYVTLVEALIPSAGITVADPVDIANGTFQVEHTDLSLGQAEPRGITLSRFYNGTRRSVNPAGMAGGWVHNYYITASAVPAPEAGLGETTPAQAAAMIVATRVALEVYNSANPSPKNWLVTALIAKWGVDQLTRNGVSVTLGKDTVQFVKQPNGAFTPPANCTMTLIQTNGAYWLQQRHGNTFKFNPSGYGTNITGQYNQSLKIDYTNNLPKSITDWKGRAFTFNYTGGKLTSVTDGTRTIGYGYTGNDLTSFTDAEGKTSSYLYDTNHQITATFDALSRLVVSNLYDASGHVTTQYTMGDTNKTWRIFWTGWRNIEQDPAGGQRVFTYDDKARLVSLQDALGKTSAMAYDGQNHLVLTVSPLNETNRFIYDGNHNVTNAIDALGYTNQFIYDNQNNLVRSVDARGNPSTFGYNGKFQMTGLTNGAGDWTTFGYDAGDGLPASRMDAGGTTSYGYDATYRQLTSVAYPGSLGGESFTNNALGDVISHRDGNGNVIAYQYNLRRQLTNTVAPTNLIIKIAYDNVGNVFSVTDAKGNVTSNTWSASRQLLKTTFPATPQGVPAVSNVYDSRDWLIRTINPQQSTINYSNDAAGRLIAVSDPLSRTTKFGYDAAGRRIATTNAAGEKTLQQWSKRGELTRVTDNANNIVLRSFDAAGNQITLTNRNIKAWQFYYDGANRLTNTVSPLGRSSSLTFDNRGLVKTVREPSGQMATNNYDAKGRLTNRMDGVASTAYGYDANDNLTSVTNVGQASSLSQTYDAYNRVSSFRDVYGNLIQYRYDANGNLTNLIYPGGKTVAYAYDSNNHLTNVLDWSGRKTSIAYDLAGRITSLTRPNGTQRVISYDAAGQTTNIVELTGIGFPIALFRHAWNSNATMAWEFAAPLPHTNSPPTRTMTYNDDNQLITFKEGTGSTLTVSGDADGNLTNAPLTNATLATYAYDARNRLLNVGGVTNAYDPAGNRIGQTQGTNSTIFVVNPNAALPQVLMRIKNGVTNYYIYGAGLLYQITETATVTNTLTYHFDYRGSTIALTDGNGNVTDRIEYSLYATTTYRTGTNDTPFLFNGRYGVQTDANGLLYMRARYYSPYLCRFINADPSGFAGGLNFYAYANGNPVSYLDAFGLNAHATSDTFFSWLPNASLNLANPFGLALGNPEPDWFDKTLDVVGNALDAYQQYQAETDAKIQAMAPTIAGHKVQTLNYLPGPSGIFGTMGKIAAAETVAPRVNVLPSSGNRFVVSPGGDAIIVPRGASGPVPIINQGGRTTGFGYTGGSGGLGLDPRVSNVRIMDATLPRGPSPGYPAGYVNYQNIGGQSVNPFTGQTIAPNNPLWHIPLTPP